MIGLVATCRIRQYLRTTITGQLHTVKFASRMGRLGTETAFEVLARARELESQGRHIVHLEIGEPDFETPQHIVEAGIQALKDGYTHYGPSAGLPEVRQVIIDEVNRTRGLNLGSNHVVITPGAKPILFFTAMAAIETGDEVIYPDPGFPIYESVISFVGGKPIPIPLRESNDFQIDIDELRSLITPQTRMIIINSPGNPTGGVLSHDQLAAIADLALKHDLWVLSDEIYSRIVYDDKHESITQFDGLVERTILLDGLSKAYAMTGWRLGYGVMPNDLAFLVSRLMTNSNSCTASFSQRAIIAALKGTQKPTEDMVAEFQSRRDMLVMELNTLPGFSCRKPQGAFYAFPSIAEIGRNSRDLAERLLEEAGVAVLSGTAFGSQGEGFLRLSYANSLENLQEGVRRIREYISK